MQSNETERKVILDTETTGLSIAKGDRVIEIGCVEMINRRLTGKVFHHYLKTTQIISPGAMQVHGISNAFLEDKPVFEDIAEAFKDFIKGAELVIHNAPFDVSFLDNELKLTANDWQKLSDYCLITDTLVMARKMHPGQKNNLDALCKRYNINNTPQGLHGALLDAQILAELYLAMTGGQTLLDLSIEQPEMNSSMAELDYIELPIIRVSEQELLHHQAFLKNQLKQELEQELVLEEIE